MCWHRAMMHCICWDFAFADYRTLSSTGSRWFLLCLPCIPGDLQAFWSMCAQWCTWIVDYGTLLCCWALIAPCTLPLCLPVECYSRCRCYVIKVCGTQIWHVYESMVLYICFVVELELFVSNLQLLWEQVLFYAADHRIRDRFSWTQVEFYSMYGFVVLMHAPLVVSWAFLGAWPHLFSSSSTGFATDLVAYSYSLWCSVLA